jgi:phage terminase large subunit-like protein
MLHGSAARRLHDAEGFVSTFTTKAFDRWRASPCNFIEEVLVDFETNKPFVLLPAQRIFIEKAFTIGSNGNLVFTEWVFAAPKKSGKTGLAAILTITTLVLFGGRFGEAYALANDYEQAQSRVFEGIKRIIAASPLLANEVKVTNDRITFNGTGAIIMPLASDAASAAGGHPVISSLDELLAYTSERSRRLFDEMVPTPTKKINARLTVTYAGFSGESQLLEDLYKRGMAQPEIAPDLRAGDGILMFWSHKPIAKWQDDAWLADGRRMLRPSQSARMYENRWVSGETSFIPIEAWDACIDPNLRSVVKDKYLSVWCAVDASTKRDSTALCAVAWSAKDQQVRLVTHQIFQPTPEKPLDFEATIEATLLDWQNRFNVVDVYYDPMQMVASSQRLAKEGMRMSEFTQTIPNLTEACQNLYDIIRGRNITAYPSEDIRLAIGRAVALEGSRGWHIIKAKQSHKIDIVIALAMAALGAVKHDTSKSGYHLAYGAR